MMASSVTLPVRESVRPMCAATARLTQRTLACIIWWATATGCGAEPTGPACSFDAPPWTAEIPRDAYLYGVGGARSAGGIQRAREKAEMSAREQLAGQITTRVERRIGRLVEDLETNRSRDDVRIFTEVIGRQVVEATLSGSEIDAFADDSCSGSSWVRVRLERARVLQALEARLAPALPGSAGDREGSATDQRNGHHPSGNGRTP